MLPIRHMPEFTRNSVWQLVDGALCSTFCLYSSRTAFLSKFLGSKKLSIQIKMNKTASQNSTTRTFKIGKNKQQIFNVDRNGDIQLQHSSQSKNNLEKLLAEMDYIEHIECGKSELWFKGDKPDCSYCKGLDRTKNNSNEYGNTNGDNSYQYINMKRLSKIICSYARPYVVTQQTPDLFNDKITIDGVKFKPYELPNKYRILTYNKYQKILLSLKNLFSIFDDAEFTPCLFKRSEIKMLLMDIKNSTGANIIEICSVLEYEPIFVDAHLCSVCKYLNCWQASVPYDRDYNKCPFGSRKKRPGGDRIISRRSKNQLAKIQRPLLVEYKNEVFWIDLDVFDQFDYVRSYFIMAFNRESVPIIVRGNNNKEQQIKRGYAEISINKLTNRIDRSGPHPFTEKCKRIADLQYDRKKEKISLAKNKSDKKSKKNNSSNFCAKIQNNFNGQYDQHTSGMYTSKGQYIDFKYNNRVYNSSKVMMQSDNKPNIFNCNNNNLIRSYINSRGEKINFKKNHEFYRRFNDNNNNGSGDDSGIDLDDSEDIVEGPPEPLDIDEFIVADKIDNLQFDANIDKGIDFFDAVNFTVNTLVVGYFTSKIINKLKIDSLINNFVIGICKYVGLPIILNGFFSSATIIAIKSMLAYMLINDPKLVNVNYKVIFRANDPIDTDNRTDYQKKTELKHIDNKTYYVAVSVSDCSELILTKFLKINKITPNISVYIRHIMLNIFVRIVQILGINMIDSKIVTFLKYVLGTDIQKLPIENIMQISSSDVLMLSATDMDTWNKINRTVAATNSVNFDRSLILEKQLSGYNTTMATYVMNKKILNQNLFLQKPSYDILLDGFRSDTERLRLTYQNSPKLRTISLSQNLRKKAVIIGVSCLSIMGLIYVLNVLRPILAVSIIQFWDYVKGLRLSLPHLTLPQLIKWNNLQNFSATNLCASLNPMNSLQSLSGWKVKIIQSVVELNSSKSSIISGIRLTPNILWSTVSSKMNRMPPTPLEIMKLIHINIPGIYSLGQMSSKHLSVQNSL